MLQGHAGGVFISTLAAEARRAPGRLPVEFRYVAFYTVSTMTQDIFGYLRRTEEELRTERPAGFGMSAIVLLLRSNACKQHDLVELRRLARDLQQINCDTIRIARAYPDVFHPNVVRSREAENRIYDAVLKRA